MFSPTPHLLAQVKGCLLNKYLYFTIALSIEIKKEIVAILREGKFNDAFQMALSARNLDLVVSTCEMVNPTQIFSQDNCPLDQSVLLSLIQQLGKFALYMFFYIWSLTISLSLIACRVQALRQDRNQIEVFGGVCNSPGLL